MSRWKTTLKTNEGPKTQRAETLIYEPFVSSRHQTAIKPGVYLIKCLAIRQGPTQSREKLRTYIRKEAIYFCPPVLRFENEALTKR